MTLHDRRGLSVSTGNRASLEHYERALDLTASYFVDPLATINAALEADPTFAAGHCLRAALALMSSERGALPILEQSVTAVEALGVRAHANRFGGSHAQRDIVHLTLIESALRAGRASLARALAEERIAVKPTNRSTGGWPRGPSQRRVGAMRHGTPIHDTPSNPTIEPRCERVERIGKFAITRCW